MTETIKKPLTRIFIVKNIVGIGAYLKNIIVCIERMLPSVSFLFLLLLYHLNGQNVILNLTFETFEKFIIPFVFRHT